MVILNFKEMIVKFAGACVILFCSCTGSKMKKRYSDRIEKVVERGAEGNVVKTFDGFMYRIYDSKGRRIESYGNPQRVDKNDN